MQGDEIEPVEQIFPELPLLDHLQEIVDPRVPQHGQEAPVGEGDGAALVYLHHPFLGQSHLPPVLLLDDLHLVLETQFELLQTDLFQLLVFAQVGFLDQGVEALCVLLVFLRQATKRFVLGNEVILDRCHPEPSYQT